MTTTARIRSPGHTFAARQLRSAQTRAYIQPMSALLAEVRAVLSEIGTS